MSTQDKTIVVLQKDIQTVYGRLSKGRGVPVVLYDNGEALLEYGCCANTKFIVLNETDFKIKSKEHD